MDANHTALPSQSAIMQDKEKKGAAAAPQDADVCEDGRDKWTSRVSFWLAAVGSAVGLGNLWRFPYQCNKWGGGAFIFAYFVALLTLGMPLLTQELALGQKHRSGDIEAFGRMNKRLRGIGLASVIGAFGIVTYYMMIIGLSTVLFFESFIVPLPYGGEGGDEYWKSVLGLAETSSSSNNVMSGRLYLATCLCWLLTFICIMRGVKSASWAVKITMPLPFLLLLVMLIKGLTLEGAGQGIREFWNFSNWEELGKPDIWVAAIGQCFFSLSVCMGVMTAYGSYNPIKQDIATDEKVIALLDIGASLLSGFVVYAVLGYLVATSCDKGDSECSSEFYGTASVGLVYAAFPTAIATFAGSNFFGIVFYLTLMLLGIDSAFSMVEAVTTVIFDSDLNTYRLKWSRPKLSGAICLLGAFVSSLYCFDTGLHWLDIIDRFINEYGMVFIGTLEAAACGWFYSYDIINSKIGLVSATLYRGGYFFGLILACILSFSLASPVEVLISPPGETPLEYEYQFTGTMGEDSWIVGFCVGIFIWLVSIVMAYLYRSEHAKRNLSFGKTMWYIVGWENVDVLRDFINGNGVGDEEWKSMKYTTAGECFALVRSATIGFWWGFFIKYWIPTVLTIALMGTMRNDRWNGYNDYPTGHLVVGLLVFLAMVFVVVIVAIFPQLMTQKADETGGRIAKQEGQDSDAVNDEERVELVSGDKAQPKPVATNVEEEPMETAENGGDNPDFHD